MLVIQVLRSLEISLELCWVLGVNILNYDLHFLVILGMEHILTTVRYGSAAVYNVAVQGQALCLIVKLIVGGKI